MQRFKSKLTYANVISTIALFLVLAGGTAFAASQWARESIPAKALKKESIGPGKLTKAAKATLVGPAGPAGPAGAPGSAVAYGHVNANGSLDTANSKNISATKLGSGGYYCVSPSVPVHGSNVSGDGGTTPAVYNSSFEDPLTSCPDGAAVVEVFRLEGGAFKPSSRQFFIVFN